MDRFCRPSGLLRSVAVRNVSCGNLNRSFLIFHGASGAVCKSPDVVPQWYFEFLPKGLEEENPPSRTSVFLHILIERHTRDQPSLHLPRQEQDPGLRPCIYILAACRTDQLSGTFLQQFSKNFFLGGQFFLRDVCSFLLSRSIATLWQSLGRSSRL